MVGGGREGIVGERHLGSGVGDLEQALPGSQRTAEELEGRPERLDRLEAAENEERQKGEVHARNRAFVHQRYGEDQCGQHRRVHRQVVEGVLQAGDRGHPLLHPSELPAEVGYLPLVPGGLAEGEQVLNPLYTVHDLGVQLGPQLQLSLSQPPREYADQERHPDARERQEAQGYEGEHWIEDVEHDESEGGDGRRHDDGRECPQVDVLQLLDVLDDAGEEVAAAVIQQAGGGEGFEAAVEPGPQVGEQPEGDVVGDQPFQVAEDGA